MEDGTAPKAAFSGRWESVSLGGVLLLTMGLLALSLGYPLWGDYQPGPGLFPTITAGLAVICAAGALVGSLGAGRQTAVAGDDAPVWRRLLVYAAVVLLWPASFATLGFALSSVIGLSMLMRAGEGMGWLPSIGVAAATVALGWLLFEVLLGVPLPHGALLP